MLRDRRLRRAYASVDDADVAELRRHVTRAADVDSMLQR